MSGWRWDGGDLLLAVQVKPRSARLELGNGTDALQARLTAPPVEGAANAQLIELLAEIFGVPKSRVTLLAGEGARMKRLRVARPSRWPEFVSAP